MKKRCEGGRLTHELFMVGFKFNKDRHLTIHGVMHAIGLGTKMSKMLPNLSRHDG